MNIGFVFTNYNNSEYTRSVVQSLEESSYSNNIKVVIVDNDSHDSDKQTLFKLEDEYPKIKIIYNDENVGYFKGLNVGIHFLRQYEVDFDFIVVGNNDLIFPEQFYDQVLSVQSGLERYPVISPDLITLDGVHQNPHIRHGVTPFREFIWKLYYSNFYLSRFILFTSRITKCLSERKDYTSYEEGGVIYQGYGACYILTKSFFKSFEELWAPTFLMGEEFFLWKQVTDNGLQIYYEPSILVQHKDHATIGKVPGRNLWEFSRDAYNKYRALK